jgi:hypothetical protein
LARTLLALGVLALAACAAPPVDPRAPTTTGQALAQATCPLRIVEANAWENHMPGAGRAPRNLQVEVRFADAGDKAIMLRSVATKPGDTLVLEIRMMQEAPIMGRVAYREPVSDPPFKRISFFCRGAEIFVINEIQRVY